MKPTHAHAAQTIDPLAMLQPRRKIAGYSAVLLPFDDHGAVDWPAYEAHVGRTIEAGLIPAVNMDTGYVNQIDTDTRAQILRIARGLAGEGGFVGGAFVFDHPGDPLNLSAHVQAASQVRQAGGLPIIFQSHGLSDASQDAILDVYTAIGAASGSFLAFELGQQFASFGRIYDLELFSALLDIPACIGLKHSSLDRSQEWQRLAVRNAQRPQFRLLTGNDLAIDMVMYGSDYLLGLSTFAPDLFARRDALWLAGDPGFYELNDLLQYLGQFTFRAPVPAYKHSAAMFLKLRGWLTSDAPHPRASRRPDSDRDVLAGLWQRLQAWETAR